MNTLRCCVVDDEPLARDLLVGYIGRTPFLKLVGTYGSAQDAIKGVVNGDIDLIFLDIEMPQLTGVEFARIVPPSCRIIFTTAYSNYAIDGFRVNALDYLLKPISYDEFVVSATKALNQFNLQQISKKKDQDRFLVVKSDYRMVQIDTDDILFVEGVKDYVKIYIVDNTSSIMTLMNMKTLEQRLPKQFMRVHRSFIVNTHRIKIIERNRIVFGTHYIPVSDSYKQRFVDYLNRLQPDISETNTDV